MHCPLVVVEILTHKVHNCYIITKRSIPHCAFLKKSQYVLPNSHFSRAWKPLVSFQCNKYSNRKGFQGICLNVPWFLTHPITEQDKKRVDLRKQEKRRAEIKEEKFIYSSLWTLSRAFKKDTNYFWNYSWWPSVLPGTQVAISSEP